MRESRREQPVRPTTRLGDETSHPFKFKRISGLPRSRQGPAARRSRRLRDRPRGRGTGRTWADRPRRWHGTDKFLGSCPPPSGCWNLDHAAGAVRQTHDALDEIMIIQRAVMLAFELDVVALAPQRSRRAPGSATCPQPRHMWPPWTPSRVLTLLHARIASTVASREGPSADFLRSRGHSHTSAPGVRLSV